MRECEEMLKIVQGCRDSQLDSRVTRDWQAAKVDTRVEHVGELKRHASCCTTGQKFQAGQAVCSRLELATPPKHLAWENLTFHIHSHPTIYILLYSRFRESFQRKF